MGMMISRIDHISIAVRNDEKARHFFRKLFCAIPGASAEDPRMQYRWELMSLGDLSRLELIHPTGPDSFLNNFLKDKEAGVHHITFETPDIQKTKTYLEENDIPFFGFREYGDFWKELFIHPRDACGVLIQIAEFKPDEWLSPDVRLEPGRKWKVTRQTPEIELQVAHPGGGKVALTLTKEEASSLIADLKKAMDASS